MMSDNLIKFPPQSSKLALVAHLESVLERVKRDEIAAFAYCACNTSEIPDDPPISLYTWCTNYALVGASVHLTKALLEVGNG